VATAGEPERRSSVTNGLDSGSPLLNAGSGADAERVTLSTNELRILGVLAEKDALEPADCSRLADLSSGMGDAALRSLVAKELVAPNLVRKGLSKKPDGTYSITPAGRASLV
jgi:DNA-binding MarR family transcriptional regulator